MGNDDKDQTVSPFGVMTSAYVGPIGVERIPCECVEFPCTDCMGLGYEDEPLFPADFVVGLDALRRELDRSYPEPVCQGCGIDCESMRWPPGALPSAFCSGCDPTLEGAS